MQGEGGIASLQGLFFPSAQELRDRLCQDVRAEPPACEQNQQSRARRGRGKAKGKRRGGKSLQCGDAEGKHARGCQQGSASGSAQKASSTPICTRI